MAVSARNPTLRAAIEGYKINGDLTIMDYPRRRKAILDDRTRAESMMNVCYKVKHKLL